MKRITLSLCLVAIACFISCSKQEDTISENELYSEMVNYSKHLAAISADIKIAKTKSDDIISNTENELNVDINAIDDKFIDYIEIYTKPDTINKWNEHSILSMIAKDSNFSNEEKINFAKCISAGYIVKENLFSLAFTKSNSELDNALQDCVNNYNLELKRAGKEFLLMLIGAVILEPSVYGEILSYLLYGQRLTDAEQDLLICFERAKRDHSTPAEGYTADGKPEN